MMKIKEYIISVRLREAKHMLNYGKNVTEAAMLCVFGSQSHFSKTFKKITGYTPSTYRKMRRGGKWPFGVTRTAKFCEAKFGKWAAVGGERENQNLYAKIALRFFVLEFSQPSPTAKLKAPHEGVLDRTIYNRRKLEFMAPAVEMFPWWVPLEPALAGFQSEVRVEYLRERECAPACLRVCRYSSCSTSLC